jgi:hypothetical protein
MILPMVCEETGLHWYEHPGGISVNLEECSLLVYKGRDWIDLMSLGGSLVAVLILPTGERVELAYYYVPKSGLTPEIIHDTWAKALASLVS